MVTKNLERRGASDRMTIDLTGQKFGRLLAVNFSGKKNNGASVWVFRCDCGTAFEAVLADVKRGQISSCGCLRKSLSLSNIVGKKFGRLFVIEEDPGIPKNVAKRFVCRCDCGKTVVTNGTNIKNGSSKSCGCLSREMAEKRLSSDLIGKRFGRLTVVGKTNKRANGSGIIWETICDCGKTAFIPTNSLATGNTTSCGCSRKKYGSTSERVRKYYSSPCKQDSKLFKQIPSCDIPMKVNGYIHVACKLCGKHFAPQYRHISSRIIAFSGRFGATENNFYCSDECKEECPIFGAQSHATDPRLRKPKSQTEKARSCQTKALKQLQCDHNNGQSYCEKCGDFVDVELHHTLTVAEFGEKAIDSSGHILLCAGCHTTIHKECFK